MDRGESRRKDRRAGKTGHYDSRRAAHGSCRAGRSRIAADRQNRRHGQRHRQGRNSNGTREHSPNETAGPTYAPLTAGTRERRAFATSDAFALWFSLGIGLLVAQAGALLVPGLSLPHALTAIVIGTAIGVVLLALAGVVGTDTGLAAMSSLRPTLGVRGASVPAVLNAVQLVGWGSFEIIVMRDSADALAKQSFGLSMPLIWTLDLRRARDAAGDHRPAVLRAALSAHVGHLAAARRARAGCRGTCSRSTISPR